MTTTDTGLGPASSLAEIILAHPGSERILDRHGLDYCCGGARSLAEAAAPLGVDADEVMREIAEMDAEPAPRWNDLGPAELADHVEAVHHAYLHEEMPRLNMLAIKVASVHGGNHPELREIAHVYGQLRDELEPHLAEEEQTVFPMIRRLVAGEDAGDPSGPISKLMSEHDDAGRLLEKLRELTDGYRTPADGCGSYHALFDGLARLEADTHLHIHIENNLLFPAVQELEGVNLPTA